MTQISLKQGSKIKLNKIKKKFQSVAYYFYQYYLNNAAMEVFFILKPGM